MNYYEIELGDCYDLKQMSVNYFSVVFLSNGGVYKEVVSNTEYKPQLIVEYIDDCDSITGQKTIDGSAGRALNYSVNARSGKPNFIKNLYSINTTVLPINLGLYFDPLNANESRYYMPKGWLFNYNQRLIANSEGYEYIDGNGIHHQFVQANKNYLYFDIAGTGLVLTKTGLTYVIDDGYNNYLCFDQSGKLIKLYKKI